VLDRRFAVAMAGWPEVTAAILDRMMARSGWLAFHLAVAHLRRVETRVHVALWHFADRWGRVRPGGIELRLNLTHALLADIVAAERPSVTLALSTGLVRDPSGKTVARFNSIWRLEAPNRWRVVFDKGSPPAEAEDFLKRYFGGSQFIQIQIPVSITWPALAKLEIIPGEDKLYTGVTLPHKLKATHADGTDRPGASASWRSSNPAVATVDRFGNVRAVSAGTVTISAGVPAGA